MRVGPAISVAASDVVQCVATAFVPSKNAVNLVDTPGLVLIMHAPATFCGQVNDHPPVWSWLMMNRSACPAFAFTRVAPFTPVLPKVRLNVLQSAASNSGLAVSATVQSGGLNAFAADTDPSWFCDRLLPAATPELL